MNDSDIEALATAIAREMLTSATGQRADYLTQFKAGSGILGTMSESALQQRIAKVIRHHEEQSCSPPTRH